MIPFLGRSVYPGPALELRPSRTSFAGQARFHGWIVFTSWPRGDVEPLLPAELELAASTAAHDMHPVVFAFGEQTEGAVIFGGLTLPSAPGYHEFGMAVPFVKLREGRLLYVYVARMYATYLPAVLAGNAYYGFGKEMATMGWRGRTFLIDGQDHRRLLHADAEPGGSWSAGSGCTLTNFDAVRATFALPVVGRKVDGTLVCSYFGWDFSEALVRSGDACISIDAPIVEGITRRRCPSAAAGAFEVRDMMWKLGWPSACRGA